MSVTQWPLVIPSETKADGEQELKNGRSLWPEGKRSPEDLILATVCPGPEVTHIISAYNLLARTRHIPLSNLRRVRKCNETMWPEGEVEQH